MTNLDKLRQAPAEVIANLLYTNRHRCRYCAFCGISGWFNKIEICPKMKDSKHSTIHCKTGIKEWLGTEVQND